MLEIKNLTKCYGTSDVKAIDNMSLTLKEGEVFGFLGPNGAGKSTTIKCVVGILPYDVGSISVCGIDIKKNPIAAKQNIGYVSDNHAVYERLTGREYVCHVASLFGVDKELVEQRSEKYLKMFRLKQAFDAPISTYSHGMKQKISVIATLVHAPKLWILDEPLTGLDPQSSYLLKQAMREHAKEGNTVFFSSHILDVVENLCDRVCIINKGKVGEIIEIADLHEKKQSLEKLFIETIGEGEEEVIG